MQKLGNKEVIFVQEILATVESYMFLEKKLTMHFDNPDSIESHSSLRPRRSPAGIVMTPTRV